MWFLHCGSPGWRPDGKAPHVAASPDPDQRPVMACLPRTLPQLPGIIISKFCRRNCLHDPVTTQPAANQCNDETRDFARSIQPRRHDEASVVNPRQGYSTVRTNAYTARKT
jgi:hypothetical protein